MKRTVKLIVLAAVAASFAAPAASAESYSSASWNPWAWRGSAQIVDPWAWRDPWASRNPMKSAPMKSARIGYDVGHATRVRPNPWGSRGCSLIIGI